MGNHRNKINNNQSFRPQNKISAQKLFEKLYKLSDEQLFNLAEKFNLYDDREMEQLAKSLEVYHPVYNKNLEKY